MGTNAPKTATNHAGRTSEATEVPRISVCGECFKENDVLGDYGFRGGRFAT